MIRQAMEPGSLREGLIVYCWLLRDSARIYKKGATLTYKALPHFRSAGSILLVSQHTHIRYFIDKFEDAF